jgi:hypothetical protein
LHIALGLNNDAIGNPILPRFTWELNKELNRQNIYVYSYGAGPFREGDTNWYVAGLSKIPPSGMGFFASFQQAAENAEGIHFNLEAIVNPVKFADTYGPSQTHLTAYCI